ncbi:uncharacterized protein LOC110177715 [Drosophila serrata]|uniref:uncharacterized protein LOC110177715 n=1 Tax=Drosophila serrata TaxID=7274 RepID=UPI000A1D1F12|nr:uncharacterized protein LOC110177715 [Drosophila serrata]
MEAVEQDYLPAAPSTTSPKPEAPVLNISGRVKPDPDAPRKRGKKKAAPAPEAPKINPTTFPVILSRILLKTDVPPASAPKVNASDYTQSVCFLCLEKPASRKRVYHMFLSNEKELGKDYDHIRQLYEKREEYKYVNNITIECPCARALYRRVQKEFTDVQWNKQRNVFETDMIAYRDVWSISNRMYAMRNEEIDRLLNFMKFMSLEKS